ncbi:hypothetical protein FHR83_007092 [Actinoplanes campanulatus]|uniref:Uncharacterized protein n=1 Tax=Actinoplanes campanulatus TaxID=113559 RepID=A0A7W5FI73_9ACTN|nr:hypothetical protein [Actinoplanes campanulatus]MBB3099386.1 hypothetical protein [Actinoplanes campanulatus]GGN40202.1 hypothetical protein GCM10010109_69000 [Actinoplanes campanulatus]GID42405.1 hypothetical protein Aca09nite_89110 [Actinoplanes campanulatus]
MNVKLAERIDDLKRAGFSVRYADPADVYEKGRIHSAYAHPFAYDETERPFVEVDGAISEDWAGQVSFWEISNFRSLERDYGMAFFRVGYTGCDGLGFFLHSVSDRLINTVIGLKEQYPVYDESDLSELEYEAAHESFSGYLFADLYSDLPEWWQEVADEFTREEIEQGFWQAVSEDDFYPECSGNDVIWGDSAEKFLLISLRNLKRKSLGRPALV